ncbi:extracellular solute-binding protein, partial [Gemmiger formicilis]|uniref:extracellular solute-binding protein n=1 Tax=Gemmiger formicilis TaxID=745368 RepID=UPI003AB46545
VERYALDTGKLIAQQGVDSTLRALCAYKDGKYLALVQPVPGPEDMEAPMTQIAVYDPATGGTTLVATLNGSYLNNVTYDPQSDTAYYCCDATIYAVPMATGESRVSAYLPVNAWSGSDTTFGALSGGMIVYANGDGAYVRRLDAPEMAAGALTVANEGGTTKHMAVVAEHPELNVTLASNYPQTMEELTTAMVSGTGSMDVLCLTTSYNPVERLIDKGYAADLSGYPELMAVAGRMDPRFTQSVMRDGKLYALPVALSTNTLGVNAEAMEKLGLTESDLPATWLEFLDFAANYYYDYGEENADVALMDLNMRRPLFQMIRDQYVAAQLRDTGSVSFDTPLFRKLMQALEAIDFTELDPYEVKGDKIWEGNDANEFYEKQQLFTRYSEASPRAMDQSGYGRSNQPLILRLDSETEPVLPVSMTVMIVNPRSTRMDQAAAYLTAYAGHYDAETENIMFFPDQNDPVPNSYYEVQKQSYEESLRDVDSRIEKADESEKASLRETREQIQGYLDELENQRMSVTEEMIQAYREQVAPYLYVTPQTPLTNPESSNELDTLTSQYLDHAIDLDTYIREMDQRVRMMMLEDM